MWKIERGGLWTDDTEILQSLPPSIQLLEDPTACGVFLKTLTDPPEAWQMHTLGVPLLKRFLACHRYEPWWMKPHVGSDVTNVPMETQVLFGEMSDGRILLVVPLIDGPMRCSLQGGEGGTLDLVAESGNPSVTCAETVGIFLAVGDDVHDLCRRGATAVLAHMDRRGTACHGRLRRDKPLPAFIEEFGWCTWDAFYQDVSHEKVREGLASFAGGGVSPRFLILDDGWQSTDDQGSTKGRRLSSFAPNDKFSGDLTPSVNLAKEQFGIRHFLVWHALQGYWCGADPYRFAQYDIRDVAKNFSPGIRRHCPNADTQLGGATVGVVSSEHAERFFRDYHRSLRAMGVDGVKVDNQASLEATAADTSLGRVGLYSAYRDALEASTSANLGGNLINCMACANDILYGLAESTLVRTSIDFWPRRPETHGLHLWTNAAVSLWFAEFVHPDWDMFQSGLIGTGGEAWGSFHATARAISGGPLYVSDKPGRQDFALLRKLVLSDGTVPQCDGPARLSRECLFRDVTRGDGLLKIWNTNQNGQAGVVGLFNCRYDPAARAGDGKIAGVVTPHDVPGLKSDRFVMYLHRAGRAVSVARDERLKLTLGQSEWEVITIATLTDGFAFIGLVDKINSGGTMLRSDFIDSHLQNKNRRVQEVCLTLRDGGKLGLWTETRPTWVKVGDKSVRFTWENGWLTVDLPARGPQRVTLTCV